jgi:phage terminase large subunit-like protein
MTPATALAALPEAQRRAVLADLSAEDLRTLEWAWQFWARPDQLAPAGAWRTWLLLGGRGSGKTRSAAEWVRAEIESGRRRAIGIIGPTADTLRRDVVQGPSGLLAIAPPWMQPLHEPSQRRVVWPNGAVAYLLSSEEPDRIRGMNLDGAWGDEVTSWQAPEDCWSNLQMALRISGPDGVAPAGVMSTTPKRHTLLRAIIKDPATVITRSRTWDNSANLDPATLAYLQTKYGGTTLGRQELDAELLEDVDGALWTRDLLEACRVPVDDQRRFKRVVVAVDPAGGTGAASTETGIVVAGVGQDGHAYVLADLSGKFSPERWAYTAAAAYQDHRADRVVAERNFGGAMVESTLRAASHNVPVRMVQASRGKAVRAEPVTALFEQRRVHLVGQFAELEDQLCGWDPMGSGPSPDRLDALVWAITDLLLGEAAPKPARFIDLNWSAR